jgi:hypothetical protein
MSPMLNKKERIPNIVLTLPVDEPLSDIEGNIFNLKSLSFLQKKKKIISLKIQLSTINMHSFKWECVKFSGKKYDNMLS